LEESMPVRVDLRSNVTFMEMDFDDIEVGFLETMDAVIHLAAITNAAQSFDNKSQIEEINVEKTKRLIDRVASIEESQRPVFIFPSSTSVYGKASENVVEDDASFLNPQSPYAESKILIEEYLKDSPIKYRVFRLGTVFGTSKGMRFHTAINKFCYQAAFGIPLTIWRENYEQYRPYLGLSDAKQIMDMAIQDMTTGVFNVITDNYRLSDIVGILKTRVGPMLSTHFVDTPLLNQFPYKVNMQKITDLGYSPIDSLEESINSTLKLLGK
jgi:nucleoside-diphosphate-sugar epimerase